MPNTAESSESSSRAPGGSLGSSPLKRNTSTEPQTFPARLRPLLVTAKKHTKPPGKLTHYHGVCHLAARHAQVKPLKTKTLDVDIKTGTPKSRYSLPFSAILCHFLENLYTPTANLFGFNHFTSRDGQPLYCAPWLPHGTAP